MLRMAATRTNAFVALYGAVVNFQNQRVLVDVLHLMALFLQFLDGCNQHCVAQIGEALFHRLLDGSGFLIRPPGAVMADVAVFGRHPTEKTAVADVADDGVDFFGVQHFTAFFTLTAPHCLQVEPFLN